MPPSLESLHQLLQDHFRTSDQAIRNGESALAYFPAILAKAFLPACLTDHLPSDRANSPRRSCWYLTGAIYELGGLSLILIHPNEQSVAPWVIAYLGGRAIILLNEQLINPQE